MPLGEKLCGKRSGGILTKEAPGLGKIVLEGAGEFIAELGTKIDSLAAGGGQFREKAGV